MNPLHWLATHDPGYAVARRAARTAIIMPSLFALGDEVFGNPQLATFAAFGSFAMLLLVDFGGPMRERLQAQAALAVAGAVLVCLGTLASRDPWLAAASMALVAFAVLFAGVVSSVLASASTSLLLAFILPVSQASPASTIPDRLLGWGLASGAALVAIARALACAHTESSAHARDRRLPGARCTAARRGRPPARGAQSPRGARAGDRRGLCGRGRAAQTFLATPYRPTGLSTPARTIVRLVDELNWLNGVMQSRPLPGAGTVGLATCGVKDAAAAALERGADLLEAPAASPEPLRAAVGDVAAGAHGHGGRGHHASFPSRPQPGEPASSSRRSTRASARRSSASRSRRSRRTSI